jgi:hypothetical protein
MDDDSSGRSQGLLHLHPQKYTGAESGVASPKAFIYRWVKFRVEEKLKVELKLEKSMTHIKNVNLKLSMYKDFPTCWDETRKGTKWFLNFIKRNT